MPQSTNSEFALLARIIKNRDEKTFRKERANLSRGIEASTEHYAIPYVYRFLPEDASKAEVAALTRAAALAAIYTSIKPFSAQETPDQNKKKPFGRWCYELSLAYAKKNSGTESVNIDPDRPDPIGQRLLYLHTQSFEEATRSIRRLLQIADGLGGSSPQLDYVNLYYTLKYWGNGVSEESRTHRLQILRNYYGSFSTSDNSSENN
ncbi:CRISPR type I-E-associated protein CasB/Cse2 [Arcanobacterium pluranimalium]|uniref:type I-E CRISPR-associated protein Cse2/CasB n=1 Tax=Arcanobacterium pluranimalium TaxID=108028 RepID=UPI00195684F8|nr:type I-E CRISPR-associated protein Cse2/CasB [Arcanobacterium pluranimalium]MBM7824569.1 CRISPR type I-E-associated protein CasB/Cse2 [Arcanobacterium pluranimalium]